MSLSDAMYLTEMAGKATAAVPPLPTVGRIVHYYPLPSGTVPLAAIVTAVELRGVALTVFEPGNRTADALVNVTHSAEPKPGHWSWPPRS